MHVRTCSLLAFFEVIYTLLFKDSALASALESFTLLCLKNTLHIAGFFLMRLFCYYCVYWCCQFLQKISLMAQFNFACSLKTFLYGINHLFIYLIFFNKLEILNLLQKPAESINFVTHWEPHTWNCKHIFDWKKHRHWRYICSSILQ